MQGGLDARNLVWRFHAQTTDASRRVGLERDQSARVYSRDVRTTRDASQKGKLRSLEAVKTSHLTGTQRSAKGNPCVHKRGSRCGPNTVT